ncbi:MAG: MotA/TolQ/ExbB proton channel family protein [Betaproteobacteria bacterium]|nr:MotA/TolQ/ExbB proton channel family protein [Betaproteobacteria bacterium]
MTGGLGYAHFLAQTDAVGWLVLSALLVLSILSWYFIVTKTWANYRARREAEAFLSHFRISPFQISEGSTDNAFGRLAGECMRSLADAHNHKLEQAGGLAEFLTRTLNTQVDQEAAEAERGLTLLASAGSAAPYIGLFGTVWGIYHALLQIGLSGQGTLDKVAGPVGEALIMTALGLAVAIPASLAYNAFGRRNRLWLARLEAFAHELYVLLAVKAGSPAAARK